MNANRKLIEMIQDFDTAMLVTHCGGEKITARPMAIAKVDEDGGTWFVSDRGSGKIDDLEESNSVAVTMQGKARYVVISGKARVVSDREMIAELWKESWEVWFPEGKADPSIVLIHVIPSHGEYWDNSGTSGLRYLLKAGIAYLQGDRPDVDRQINASTSM